MAKKAERVKEDMATKPRLNSQRSKDTLEMLSQIKKQILGQLSEPIIKILSQNRPADIDELQWIVSLPTDYHDPLLLPDVLPAIRIIRDHIENNGRIALFGDKDVDGITAVASLSRFFDSLQSYVSEKQNQQGISKRDFYYTILLADDNDADYGLTEKIVDEALRENCSLIITLDTGTSDFEAIEYAKKKGLMVIVIDHHETKETLPMADALVNPKRRDSKYPFAGLATAGLVFKLCHAFLISFGNALLFLWRENSHLILQMRHQGEIINFYDIQDMRHYLAKMNPETAANLRIVFADRDLRAEFFGIMEEFGLASNVDLWTNIVSRYLSTAKGNKDEMDSGFSLWGNPLTGLSITSILMNQDNLLRLLDLPRAYQILQFCISKKIFRRLQALLPLVALGTLADMMPLESENRVLARIGLHYLRRGDDRSMQLIIDYLNIMASKLRSRNITWSITPILNSPGRLGNGLETLNFFLSRKTDIKIEQLELLLDINKKRKEMVEDGQFRAVELYNQCHPPEDESLVAVVLEQLPNGLSGLIAARLADYFERPTVVIIRNGEKAIGSARSFGGEDVLGMIEDVSDKMILYGGHTEASGFSLKSDDIDDVIKRFSQYYQEHIASNRNCCSRDDDLLKSAIEIDIHDVDYQLMSLLDWLEPFGMSNHEPCFLVSNIPPLNFRAMGKDSSHGKFTLTMKRKNNDQNNAGLHELVNIEIIGWKMSSQMRNLANASKAFKALVELDYNYFRGELRISMFLKKIIE